MSDASSTGGTGPRPLAVPLLMLPGDGPSCEGAGCLPAAADAAGQRSPA